METTIYFVRHAHSTYSPDELNRPLSEKGIQDAIKVTSVLSKVHIDYVFSSPFKRSIQTIEGVAMHHHKEIILDERLKERLLSNTAIVEFDQAIMKSWTDFNFCFKGGESNHQAQLRGIHAIKELLSHYNEKTLLIGTHGNLFVLILNYFDKQYGHTFWKGLSMPAVYKLTFDQHTLINVEEITYE